MSDDAPFLRSIEESPEDDAPRLIYADWLQERADPRADFIRAHCEMARRKSHTADWHELRLTCQQLLASYLSHVSRRTQLWKTAGQHLLQLHRGFPVRVTAAADDLGRLDEWQRHVPLSSLVIHSESGAAPEAQSGVGEAALQRLSDLAMDAPSSAQIFQCLPKLQSLAAVESSGQGSLATALSQSTLPDQLRSLDLLGTLAESSERVVVEFSQLRRLSVGEAANRCSLQIVAPKLQSLALGNVDMQMLETLPLEQLQALGLMSKFSHSLETLSQRGAFENLRSLKLAGVNLATIRHLLSNDWAKSLEGFSLWIQEGLQQNILGTALLESLPEGRLQHVRGRNWGPHEFSALLQQNHPLESLILTNSNFDPGVVHLPFAMGRLAKTLLRLEFRYCRLGEKLAQAVGECSFEQLTALSVSGCDLPGIERLLATESFPNLRQLELANLKPNYRRGINAVIRTLLDGDFPHLLELNLDETSITAEQAREILHSPRFPRLKRLVHRQLSEQESRSLAEDFGARFDAQLLDAVLLARARPDYASI